MNKQITLKINLLFLSIISAFFLSSKIINEDLEYNLIDGGVTFFLLTIIQFLLFTKYSNKVKLNTKTNRFLIIWGVALGLLSIFVLFIIVKNYNFILNDYNFEVLIKEIEFLRNINNIIASISLAFVSIFLGWAYSSHYNTQKSQNKKVLVISIIIFGIVLFLTKFLTEIIVWIIELFLFGIAPW